jgi:hypothetical protein
MIYVDHLIPGQSLISKGGKGGDVSERGVKGDPRREVIIRGRLPFLFVEMQYFIWGGGAEMRIPNGGGGGRAFGPT